MRRVFPQVWLAPRGIAAYVAVGVLASLASIATPFVYIAGLAAIVVVALSIADAIAGTRDVSIERDPIAHLVLAKRATIGYRVRNLGNIAVRFGIVESPVATLATNRDFVLGVVAAVSETQVSQTVLPEERGVVRFTSVFAWMENTFGLLRRRCRFDLPLDARVMPDLSLVARYDGLARRTTLIELGQRKLRLRGQGSEFESLREYVPGDAFRAVDWKGSARRGHLMVMQYEVERSQHVIVALDCGRLMVPRIGTLRKFDYALSAALSLAQVAQRTGDQLGIEAFAAKSLLSVAPRRGAAHVAALSRMCYDLQPRLEEPDYERQFAAIKSRNAKRSLIVLFTDMFDPAASTTVLSGLRVLVPRHLVVCVLMNDAAISSALAAPPQNDAEAYRTSVALRLADERAKAVSIMRSLGIITVDVPAQDLTLALLDTYLDIKARALL